MWDIGPNLKDVLIGLFVGIGLLIYFWMLIEYVKRS